MPGHDRARRDVVGGDARPAEPVERHAAGPRRRSRRRARPCGRGRRSARRPASWCPTRRRRRRRCRSRCARRAPRARSRPRCCGCRCASAPLPCLPMPRGVRQASMIKASVMLGRVSRPCHDGAVTYAFDPELAPIVDLLPRNEMTDVARAREFIVEMIAPLNAKRRHERRRHRGPRDPGPAGDPAVAVRIYSPDDAPPAAGRPGLFDIHGGGFVVGNIEMEHAFGVQVARKLGAVFVTVEYRLAPEHPFPAGVEDCYAALCVDARAAPATRRRPRPHRASAGRARAAGWRPRPRSSRATGAARRCASSSSGSPSSTTGSRRPACARSSTRRCGTAPTRSSAGSTTSAPDHTGPVSPYASPAIAPPTSAGCRRRTSRQWSSTRCATKGSSYALRMMEAGVCVELHSYPGTFHGSGMVTTAAVSRRAQDELMVALARGLGVVPEKKAS